MMPVDSIEGCSSTRALFEHFQKSLGSLDLLGLFRRRFVAGRRPNFTAHFDMRWGVGTPPFSGGTSSLAA